VAAPAESEPYLTFAVLSGPGTGSSLMKSRHYTLAAALGLIRLICCTHGSPRIALVATPGADDCAAGWCALAVLRHLLKPSPKRPATCMRQMLSRTGEAERGPQPAEGTFLQASSAQAREQGPSCVP